MSGNMLPRAFLQAPLANGIGRYVCQLQRVTIKFCKSRLDSKGVRNYIERYLVDFTRQNPGVVVYLKPRRHRGALIVAEYLNGYWQYVSATRMEEDEISKWMELLKTRSGYDIVPIYQRLRTHNPSTQGVWHPTLNMDPKNVALSLSTDNIIAQLKELSAATPLEKSATDIVRELYERQKIRLKDE